MGQKYSVPLTCYVGGQGSYREWSSSVPMYRDHDLLVENMAFVRELAAEFDCPIYVGCLDKCAGDQYKAQWQEDSRKAYELHRRHLDQWLAAEPDYLYSGIMPQVRETVGIAQAFSDSGLPYHIAFILRDDGRLLDGTTLHDAISMVDDATERPAQMFQCNCIHPSNLRKALDQPFNRTETVRTRLLGTIANASTLKPEELEGNDHVENASAEALAQALVSLHQVHPMRLVGGCCGTDHRHMEQIVSRMEAHLHP